MEAFTDGPAAVAALNAADSGMNDDDLETVLLGAETFGDVKITHGRYVVSPPADLQPVPH